MVFQTTREPDDILLFIPHESVPYLFCQLITADKVALVDIVDALLTGDVQYLVDDIHDVIGAVGNACRYLRTLLLADIRIGQNR